MKSENLPVSIARKMKGNKLVCDKGLMNDDWCEYMIDRKHYRLIKFANDVGFAHKTLKVSSS